MLRGGQRRLPAAVRVEGGDPVVGVHVALNHSQWITKRHHVQACACSSTWGEDTKRSHRSLLTCMDELSAPTGLVAGEDRAIPPAGERWMYRRANARKVVEVPTSSHVAKLSHSTIVADLLQDAAQATC